MVRTNGFSIRMPAILCPAFRSSNTLSQKRFCSQVLASSVEIMGIKQYIGVYKSLNAHEACPEALSERPQTETMIHQVQSAAKGVLVPLFLTHQSLDLLLQQCADGGGSSGGKDLGLPEGFCTETHGYVLLSSLRNGRLLVRMGWAFTYFYVQRCCIVEPVGRSARKRRRCTNPAAAAIPGCAKMS